jgi:hypothetical protein
MAKTVYNLAWPTATYREVSIDGFEPADNGFDVLVKLSGQSAFDNSDLWVRLAFMFRDGKFYDIRVKDHNAILVPPFRTTMTLATVAAGLAKDYADQQAAQAANGANPNPAPAAADATSASPTDDSSPAPATAPSADASSATPPDSATVTATDPNAPSAEGTCLHNPTTETVTYQYRWGDGEWKQDTLAPNELIQLWWKYEPGEQSSPQLTIQYEDDSETPGVIRAYSLDRVPTTQPPACADLTNYRFQLESGKTLVYADPR